MGNSKKETEIQNFNRSEDIGIFVVGSADNANFSVTKLFSFFRRKKKSEGWILLKSKKNFIQTVKNHNIYILYETDFFKINF